MLKELTELKVADLWTEYQQNFQDHWEEEDKIMKLLKKRLLEESLEAERDLLSESEFYERTTARKDYRNGYYTRFILTKMGLLEIRKPRLRQLKIKSQVLKRYQRRTAEVDAVLKKIFLFGVSTRLAGEAIKPLLGESVSAQTISNIAKGLDSEVKAYHKRALEDKHRYLFLDGIVLKSKTGLGVSKKTALTAYGITIDGEREIIDFMVTNSEAERKWEGFLWKLYERGFKGEHLELIITDGGKGLLSAIDMFYPQVRKQRCWAHKLRNVANRLKKADREACVAEARAIYDAVNRQAALVEYHKWARKWEPVAPKAVQCLREDLEELLNVYYCPRESRKKLRTTNVIERSFREVRRRTRPMSCFNNTESIERIVYAVISHLNEKWRNNPLNEFTQNS